MSSRDNFASAGNSEPVQNPFSIRVVLVTCDILEAVLLSSLDSPRPTYAPTVSPVMTIETSIRCNVMKTIIETRVNANSLFFCVLA